MRNYDILYLGSQSKSRQKLLTEVGLPYKVLDHKSDESLSSQGIRFFDYVLALAKHKMDHVVFPEYSVGTKENIFILTADSLSEIRSSGQILGKPKDRQDAIRMIRLVQEEPVVVATGCCLEKRAVVEGRWVLKQSQSWVTSAEIEFFVDEDCIDLYLKRMPEVLFSCGAENIEGFGQLFFKSIKGSYSAVIGLPLFELRQALLSMNFVL